MDSQAVRELPCVFRTTRRGFENNDFVFSLFATPLSILKP